MSWTVADRVAAVPLFWREGSVIKALRAFKRELGRQQAHTLLRWVRRFQEQGNVSGVQPGRGRPHVPDEMIRRVQQAMRRNPRLSIRRLSARTGIPRATVHRAVRQVLRLHPYKLQLVQSLHRGDKRRRVEFSQWLLQKWSSASFRKGLIVSDEANFYLSGTVNKQNCRVWGLENPHITLESDIQSPHLTVWCGLCSRGIIGPYFSFEGGHSVTVTSSRYRCMLDDCFVAGAAPQSHFSAEGMAAAGRGHTTHRPVCIEFPPEQFPRESYFKRG